MNNKTSGVLRIMEYATSGNKYDCVKLSVRDQIATSGHHLELVLLSSVF
jgi:hypothetical protein